ncbi:MAG TPA: biotin/lipoyl-containing protein, partial [Acidimicrobiales bacterium]
EPFRVHTRWIETVLDDALGALPRSVGHSEAVPDGGRRRLTLEVDGRRVEVTLPAEFGSFGGPALPPPPPRHRKEQADAGHGVAGDAVASPMQAKVVVLVAVNGQRVMRGDTLVDVEAMKMEQSLRAPRDGWVQGLTVKVGDEVQRGEVLCRVVDTPSGEGAQ